MKTEKESTPRGTPSGAEKVANLNPKRRPKERQKRVKFGKEIADYYVQYLPQVNCAAIFYFEKSC